MSVIASIVFFSTTKPTGDLHIFINKCLSAFGVSQCDFVLRSECEDNTWELIEAAQNEVIPYRDLGKPVVPSKIASFYMDGRCLLVDLTGCQLHRRLDAVFIGEIDTAISKRYSTSDMSMRVGWHDIFDHYEDEHGKLYGRAFFSLSFWGHRPPDDLERFREVVLKHPEILKIKSEIEETTGWLDSCFVLS